MSIKLIGKLFRESWKENERISCISQYSLTFIFKRENVIYRKLGRMAN